MTTLDIHTSMLTIFNNEHQERGIPSSVTYRSDALNAATLIYEALKNNHAVFFCGNGGSMSEAQHIAAEYVVRLSKDNPNQKHYRVFALADQTILSAASNDFGFEEAFALQLHAYAKKDDVVILLSTSGQSKNILRALTSAKVIGCKVIAITGIRSEGRLLDTNVSIWIHSTNTAIIQEKSLQLNHIIAAMVIGMLEHKKGADDPAARVGAGIEWNFEPEKCSATIAMNMLWKFNSKVHCLLNKDHAGMHRNEHFGVSWCA